MRLRDSRPYVCVLFDLAQTAAPFLRRLTNVQRVRGVPTGVAYMGDGPAGAVLAYTAGVGSTATHSAISAVLNLSRRPTLVIGAGLAVALQPGLAVGAVVQPAEVLAATTEAVFETTDVPGLLPHQQGRVVTVPRLPANAAEARTWGELGGADSADHDSAEAIRHCGRAGVPFTCLRAMLADADAPVATDAIAGLEDWAWRMLCQPRRWREWWNYTQAAKLAAEALALCLYTGLPGAARGGRRVWEPTAPLALAQPVL
jgi:nucleoside phosphorylase